jgi:competence protein CoiA
LTQQAFPFYVPQRLSFEMFQTLWASYKQENTYFLHSRLMFSRAGVNDDLLRAMYELKLSRDKLPPFIGIVVKEQEHIPTPAVEWQILLFYYVYVHRFTFASLSNDMILYFLDWANLSITEQAQMVVMRYVQMIVAMNIEGTYSEIDEKTVIKHMYDELFAIE